MNLKTCELSKFDDEPVETDKPVIMDDEDAYYAHWKPALDRIDAYWRRGLRKVVQYPGDQAMALDALLLATGNGDLITTQDGSETIIGKSMVKRATAVDVAVKHYGDAKKKATVNKLVKKFQAEMGMEAGPGQRSAAGCKNMSEARKSQLKGTK